jgi:hypothetical protein
LTPKSCPIRAQIEGGNIAGYVEQLQAEEWHYVAADHQD